MQVIEYIQFLQEKVDKYEGSYQGWNQEPPKLMPWVNPELGFAVRPIFPLASVLVDAIISYFVAQNQ